MSLMSIVFIVVVFSQVSRRMDRHVEILWVLFHNYNVVDRHQVLSGYYLQLVYLFPP